MIVASISNAVELHLNFELVLYKYGMEMAVTKNLLNTSQQAQNFLKIGDRKMKKFPSFTYLVNENGTADEEIYFNVSKPMSYLSLLRPVLSLLRRNLELKPKKPDF